MSGTATATAYIASTCWNPKIASRSGGSTSSTGCAPRPARVASVLDPDMLLLTHASGLQRATRQSAASRHPRYARRFRKGRLRRNAPECPPGGPQSLPAVPRKRPQSLDSPSEPWSIPLCFYLYLDGAGPRVKRRFYDLHHGFDNLPAAARDHQGLRPGLVRQARIAGRRLRRLYLLPRRFLSALGGQYRQLGADLGPLVAGHYCSRRSSSRPTSAYPALPGCGGWSGGFFAIPTICSGFTGTRGRSPPVASLKAATIAGVEDIVGGSPAPFRPEGASGSGDY